MGLPWQLGDLPALSALAATLELDTVTVGQWMLSRPIVVGPAMGWALGNPALGISMGVLLELLTVADLPVGNVIPPNAALATSAAVLLAGGDSRVVAALALPAGLAVGGFFSRVEAGIRTRQSGFVDHAMRALESEGAVPWMRITAAGIIIHWAAALLCLYLAVAVLGPMLAWSWQAAPLGARRALEWAYAAAPWLGWGSVLYSLRPR